MERWNNTALAASGPFCPHDVIVFQVGGDARDVFAPLSSSLQSRAGYPAQVSHYLAMYEKHVGLSHPSSVCTFSGLGNVYLALAKYGRAERFFWDALNIWQQMPEPQHPFLCASLSGLAQLSIARGNYAQAELYLQQERAHLEHTLHPLHPDLAHDLNDWALLFIAQGKYQQAEPLLRQLLTMVEQTVGLQHPMAGCTFDMLGGLSYLQEKYMTAEQFFQKAQSIPMFSPPSTI